MDPTPIIRLAARRRLEALRRERPAELQARLLRHLVARGAGTRFGRDHGLARVRTVADFQQAVPLRTYEEHWEAYWKGPFRGSRG